MAEVPRDRRQSAADFALANFARAIIRERRSDREEGDVGQKEGNRWQTITIISLIPADL